MSLKKWGDEKMSRVVPLKDQLTIIIEEVKGLAERVDRNDKNIRDLISKLVVYDTVLNSMKLKQEKEGLNRLDSLEVKINRLMEMMMNLPTHMTMDEQIQKLKMEISHLQADNDALNNQLKFVQHQLIASSEALLKEINT